MLLKLFIIVCSLKSFVLKELTVHAPPDFFFYLNIKPTGGREKKKALNLTAT